MLKHLLLSVCLLSACTTTTVEDESSKRAEPSTHSWASMAAAPIAGRSAHAAVWTGSSMIVAFGVGEEGPLADGARYAPATDTWTKLPASPIAARFMPLAVAVPGGAFVAFGATLGARPQDGAVYTESTDSWTKIAKPPIAGRTSAVIVATDRSVVVWGGETDSGFVADGARFDLATGTWSMIAASPLAARAFHRGVLEGGRMVVYGGIDNEGKVLGDSASYDIETDRWSTLTVPQSIAGRSDPVAAGSFLFGGRAVADGEDGCPHARVDGLAFQAGAFRSIAAAPLSPRADVAAWSAGDSLFVFGGYACESVSADGAAFDASTNTWSLLPAGGPSARRGASAVWTGSEAIVWGGTDAAAMSVADGARFRL